MNLFVLLNLLLLAGCFHWEDRLDPQKIECIDETGCKRGEKCINYECLAGPYCGDGVPQGDSGEACDLGDENLDHGACTPLCQNAVCGDGRTFSDVEECDDGNEDDTDLCRNDCTVPICGDGVVGGLEGCDDGNTVEDDECTSRCAPPTCGDGFLNDPLEQCDDGNIANIDDCLSNCLMPYCGDGVVWTGHESCDEGPRNSSHGTCTPECSFSICGDGFVADTERCDDGKQCSGEKRTPCKSDADCTAPGAICAPRDGDGCSHLCKVENGYCCIAEDGCVPHGTISPANPCAICLQNQATAWSNNTGATSCSTLTCHTSSCENLTCVLTPLDCDDHNPCTYDYCAASRGTSFPGRCRNETLEGIACDNGQFCDGLDFCTNGQCTPNGLTCPNTAPYCFEEEEICGECASSADCSVGKRCMPSTHRCGECESNRDCDWLLCFVNPSVTGICSNAICICPNIE